MNLTVIGTGYVGLVTGTCFAEMGNNVYCVDIDENKINNLKKGIIPIYEPHLATMVIDNQAKNNLLFTHDLKEALDNTNIIFIAVTMIFFSILHTNQPNRFKQWFYIIFIQNIRFRMISQPCRKMK